MLTLGAKNCDYCKGFEFSMMHAHLILSVVCLLVL